MELTSPFAVTVGDLLVSTPEWPAVLAAVGLLLVHVGALEAIFHGRGAPVRHGWWRPVVAFTLVGAVSIGLLAGPSFGAAALGLYRYREAWAVVPHGASAFGPVLALGMATFVWGSGLMALSSAWAARTRWSGLGRALLLGGALAMGPLAAQMGSIVAAGPLPTLELATPREVHVGRTLTVIPGVRSLEDWDAPPIASWTPSQRGELAVRLSASRGVVGVERTVTLVAGDEIGDPRFPLHVGQRVAYADYSEYQTGRVLFKGGRWESTLDESTLVVIGVAGVDESGPVRVFRVVVRSPGGDVVEHRVYAWNGELLAYDGADSKGFLTGDDFLPLENFNCKWDETPGPSSCTVHREGSFANGLARAFLLVVTIGIVDPGSDASTTGWTRVAFEPGLPGAPSAPITE